MNPTCEQATGQSDAAFWMSLLSRVARERVPFSGSLALTHRCNLRCIHCYVAGGGGDAGDPSGELSTGEWRRIIAEIRDAGCLHLLLTGGEPLLRPDIAEIYSFAKELGFLVTVFTNGTLIDGEILELFRRLPPRLVDISLYGAGESTYARVTGSAAAFGRVTAAIEALLGQGTRVGLKSVLLTANVDEFAGIEALARRYGVKFRRDAAIFPSLDGDRSVIGLRVPPQRVVDLEMADPGARHEWRDHLERFAATTPAPEIFSCGAGRTTFHVDAAGVLYPCVMARRFRYSLVDGHFANGWRGEIARLREGSGNAPSPCSGCRLKAVCGYCPGFFEIETGSASVSSSYLCEIGRLRQERIEREYHGG